MFGKHSLLTILGDQTWPAPQLRGFLSQCEGHGFLLFTFTMCVSPPASQAFHGLPGRDHHDLGFPLLVLIPIMKIHPALRNHSAARQSRMPAVRTQNDFFLFLTKQSSCNICGVLSCLCHSDRRQQTLDKESCDFRLSPIWGFSFFLLMKRLCEIANKSWLLFD